MPTQTQKLVLIMRGLPGVGKTYLAREYLAQIGLKFRDEVASGEQLAIMLSSDDYFMGENGVYEFDKDEMLNAHKWNFKRFVKAIEDEIPLIIIDNSNIKAFHYSHYLDYAQRKNYLVAIVTIPHNDSSNRELANRNIHGVNVDTISRMRRQFEGEVVDMNMGIGNKEQDE